jgi:hypothetical protein
MFVADAPLTAREVLSTFHQDEAFLFLGAEFTTVGLVAGGFRLRRRRFDKLLFYFAVFSFFYGHTSTQGRGCCATRRRGIRQ